MTRTGGLAVVVYGRNDSHGYNLPRRVATSLNAFAAILRDGDEILFVDCNTDDAFPSFPESIGDTLTARARELLRVIRIRPHQFRRLCPQGRLFVHEPLCRNVAIRRISPGVDWILSTNTDIVPDLLEGETLGGLLSSLDPARLHVAPRIEIPELLWESLDRARPDSVLAGIREHVSRCGLGVVVEAGDVVLHDGPGDFQLFHRDLASSLDGFDESIVGGWHVDGNFCARAARLSGANVSLRDKVFAYHLDHNRQANAIHRNTHVSVGPAVLINGVENVSLVHQREAWGAPSADLEDFHLDAAAKAAKAFSLVAGTPEAPEQQPLHIGSFNEGIRCSSRRVFPHLASHLAPLPDSCRLAYLGASTEMIRLLQQWVEGRGGQLVVSPEVGADDAAIASFLKMALAADIIVVDAWSADLADQAPNGPGNVDLRDISGELGDRCRWISKLLAELHRGSLRNDGPPPFLFASAQHTWLDLGLQRRFAYTLTPWASRVRPAWPLPPPPGIVRRFLKRFLPRFGRT